MRFADGTAARVKLAQTVRQTPFLSSLFVSSRPLYSHSLHSLVFPSRCIVQIFLLSHCFFSKRSRDLLSLLCSLSSRHLRFCPPTNVVVSLPLLCSLISLLFSSLPLLSTSLAFLSLSCFPSLLPLSLQSVVSFSLSLLSCRLLLFLLLPFGIAGASPGIPRHLLGSELRGRRTRCLRRLAFCSTDGEALQTPTLVFRPGRWRVRPRGW